MTATRRQTVFAGLDQPGAWPPTPRALRPQRLELALDSLPGVAATTRRKLGTLGLATVRDVLEHRPRRYETAADEVAIAALRQGEEVVVSGRVLNVEKRPMRGRRRTRIVARVADDTATISVTWFNQPWLADRLKPGTEVDLGQTIDSVIDSLGPLAKENSVVIERDYAEGPLDVPGDRDELLQVFENLLENACKYGQQGGRVTVSIARAEAGPEPGFDVTIRDYGPGIPEEHIPRITERLRRQRNP